MKPWHMISMFAMAAVMIVVERLAGMPSAVAWLVITALIVWALTTYVNPTS